ncbi:hypothetical protein TWF225_003777 [Orbilia oligospora]|nr:hypothetical protein TWF225_003777 [Orbilia oligospora]KAF3254245.1 hypothetical protein TWF217_007209 [Orbilia oligospora]KAF3267708.1 hypothetical protein TWF128_009212 [Orbilia oligospora]KAF3298204.1 hypothetical protein TWF132_000042 [Orbilia oligospora]
MLQTLQEYTLILAYRSHCMLKFNLLVRYGLETGDKEASLWSPEISTVLWPVHHFKFFFFCKLDADALVRYTVEEVHIMQSIIEIISFLQLHIEQLNLSKGNCLLQPRCGACGGDFERTSVIPSFYLN